MHGGSASLAINVNRYLGLVFDFGGFNVDSLLFNSPGAGFSPTRVVDAEGNVFSFLFGPRISFRHHDRLTPFLQVLGGAARASEVTVNGCAAPILACTPLPSETAFAMTAGGGLDYRLNHRIALRLIQAEYLLTHFRDPTSLTGDRGWQSNVRLSTGIVFRFGGSAPPAPPNRSPVVSCSADKRMVSVGSGEMAAVRAEASDPDSDALTYSWTTDGGTVEGSGPQARWNSSAAAAGTYTVKVRVDDGHGGSADCSSEIRVESQANRPPTLTCSAERSTVRSGDRVRIRAEGSDPDGDALTYSWRARSGQIVGSGQNVQLDTSGLPGGDYPVSGRVEDGRGGAADCSTTINVEAPPAPPQADKINECFFRASSARVDNVCKRILDDVVVRLQNDPRAKVVIVGYADSGEPRSERLAGQRADGAKKYLTENGIADDRVEVRAGGGQAATGKANYRVDVVWVPEGGKY